jgi:hypothetical protein
VMAMADALSTKAPGGICKDWKLAGNQPGPQSLLLEESMLAEGDAIWLSGIWSVDRAGLVSAPGAHLRVSSKRSGVADALPPGNWSAAVWFLASSAIGAGILWLGSAGSKMLQGW